MPSIAASPTKEERRAQFRAYRRTLSLSSYRARSTLIAHRALALPVVATASVVHVYWPQTGTREVDTRSLISALRARDATVALPVVTSYPPDAPAMEHRRYEGPQALLPNRWGIPEPVETSPVSPEALDVVLVPALGADRTGHRIGHGSGYYDAFLSGLDVPTIGLVYEACCVASVPAAAHDVPLTTIVTERRTVHP